MEHSVASGYDRRAFLRNTGRGASVLALSPLLAGLANAEAPAAPPSGTFDFDTPFNRIGSDSIHWDLPMRAVPMRRIVAGMGVADMDFRCAPAITAALKTRVDHENWGYNLFELDLALGDPSASKFVQGIVEWNTRRHGLHAINPHLVGVTTGVHSGIIAALRAFAPRGSKVLMATPIYAGFYGDTAFTKTVAEESPMTLVNGRYEIDWDDFERRMTPEVKVSILCNPQNPVGRAWTLDELTRYGELCLKHKIIVLSDEIHCDFVSKGQKYVPFANIADKAIVANSITFKSASKSFSIPAMKCAWFFSTSRELFEATNAENHVDLSTLGMLAARAAYSGGEAWLDQCVSYLDSNLDFTHQYITSNIPLIKVGQKPEATYLVWLDTTAVAERIGAKRTADELNRDHKGVSPLTGLPGVVSPEDMVTRWCATNAAVWIQGGDGFGKGGQNHMRMNVATSRQTLKAALDSLGNALKQLA